MIAMDADWMFGISAAALTVALRPLLMRPASG